jgi:hypothetical protein
LALASQRAASDSRSNHKAREGDSWKKVKRENKGIMQNREKTTKEEESPNEKEISEKGSVREKKLNHRIEEEKREERRKKREFRRGEMREEKTKRKRKRRERLIAHSFFLLLTQFPPQTS